MNTAASTLRFGFLVFPAFEELDLIGLWGRPAPRQPAHPPQAPGYVRRLGAG